MKTGNYNTIMEFSFASLVKWNDGTLRLVVEESGMLIITDKIKEQLIKCLQEHKDSKKFILADELSFDGEFKLKEIE